MTKHSLFVKEIKFMYGKQSPIYIDIWQTLRMFVILVVITGLILGLRPANGRRRYFVTASLTDWVQA